MVLRHVAIAPTCSGPARAWCRAGRGWRRRALRGRRRKVVLRRPERGIAKTLEAPKAGIRSIDQRVAPTIQLPSPSAFWDDLAVYRDETNRDSAIFQRCALKRHAQNYLGINCLIIFHARACDHLLEIFSQQPVERRFQSLRALNTGDISMLVNRYKHWHDSGLETRYREFSCTACETYTRQRGDAATSKKVLHCKTPYLHGHGPQLGQSTCAVPRPCAWR